MRNLNIPQMFKEKTIGALIRLDELITRLWNLYWIGSDAKKINDNILSTLDKINVVRACVEECDDVNEIAKYILVLQSHLTIAKIHKLGITSKKMSKEQIEQTHTLTTAILDLCIDELRY